MRFASASAPTPPTPSWARWPCPNQSGHIYLVTNRHGQRHLITVPPFITGEMYGILTTLLSGRGSALTPIAAPIALLPIANVAAPSFGRIGESDANYAAYRAHRVAAGKNAVFTFALTDTSKILPILLECVAAHLNPGVGVASNSKTTVQSSRAQFQTEAAVIAANLLSQAGISGFRLASTSEIPGMKADVAWVAGDVVGAITVFPEIDKKQINEVRSILIGADAKNCKGTFFSGSIPDDGAEQPISRVFTTCQVNASSGTSYYLAVPRKAGGIYVLQTMIDGASEKPAKEADASIRKAVFSAIPK